MKRFSRPDPKAPRFKERRISVLTLATLKKFKKSHPEYDIDLKKFKQIIMTFNSLLVQGIIDNRNGISLPEGLGNIFMGTCPAPKAENVDYARSFKYGVRTTYRNWDSDNNLLKIFYSNYNTRYSFHNKQVWAFKAGKEFRKAASDAYKEDWTKYIKVDPHIKISTMFSRYRRREYIQNLKPVIPEGYDEFKL